MVSAHRRVICLCELFDDIDPDIIYLQETWLLDSNCGRLSEVSDQFMYYAVVGVDHCQNLRHGRAHVAPFTNTV